MPAHFLPLRRTSFGQRRSAASPATCAMASWAARPRASMTTGKSFALTGRRIAMETYNPASASECQLWPWRPIPAICWSAPTTVPEAQPLRASCAARVMVEPMLGNHSMRRSGRRARTETISNGIDATVDIDGGGGMGDRAGGDEIRPGLGVGAHVVERDAARNFRFRAAADEFDLVGGLLRRHIIEQQARGGTLKGIFDFGVRADLDF